MTTVPRPCIVCGALSRGTRCPAHTQRQARGYTDAYRIERTALLAGNPSCWKCPAPATTADHVPPLRSAPTPAEWRGVLKPACARHNYGWRSDR